MQEKKHHIKVDGELLHQYHHGKLGNEQKNEIEKIALTDAFVSDALDGFEQDPNALVHLQQIQHKLFLKTKQNRKGIGFYIKPYYPHMAVAATLFVLVFSGYFILIHSSNEGAGTAQSKNVADSTPQLAKVDIPDAVYKTTTPKIDKIKDAAQIKQVSPQANATVPNDVVVQQEAAYAQEDLKVSPAPNAQNQKEVIQKETEVNTQMVSKDDEAGSFKAIPRAEAVPSIAKTEAKAVLEMDDDKKKVMVTSVNKTKAARAYGNSELRNTSQNLAVNNDSNINENVAYDSFNAYTKNHPLHCYDASGIEIKGEVKLRFNVGNNGKPENIKVIKSLSAVCDQMAIEQLMKGYVNGIPKKKREVVTIKF